MKEISNSEDIRFLVNEFYNALEKDELIGHFFTQGTKLDWDVHLPIISSFWESLLLGNNSYQGNPMMKHIELNKKDPIKPEHFDRWLSLWEQTIQKNFFGEKAEEAAQRAKHIGGLMLHKIKEHSK